MTAVRDDLQDFCYFLPFINAFGSGLIPSPREFSSFLENKEVRVGVMQPNVPKVRIKIYPCGRDTLNFYLPYTWIHVCCMWAIFSAIWWQKYLTFLSGEFHLQRWQGKVSGVILHTLTLLVDKNRFYKKLSVKKELAKSFSYFFLFTTLLKPIC